MFKVFVTVVFDKEIVNNKGEGDVVGLVEEITFNKGQFFIACSGQTSDDVVVSNFSSLFQAIPGFIDFSVGIITIKFNVVLVNDGLWDSGSMKMNITNIR